MDPERTPCVASETRSKRFHKVVLDIKMPLFTLLHRRLRLVFVVEVPLALTLLFLGSSGRLGAQPLPRPPLDPHLRITQYLHQAWQVENGLPQNSVQAIVQTRDGYLWLGTQEGLVRFDGVRMTHFDRTNTPALQNNQIQALLEDRQGGLWVGTNGGGVSRLHGGRMVTYTMEDGLPSSIVLVLYQDDHGRVWIGTNGGGLCRFDGATFTTFGAAQGLPGNNVLALGQDRKGALWIGTEAGLSRFHDGTFATYTTAHGLPSEVVRAVHIDRDGVLWAGTSEGLARLEGDRFVRFTVDAGLPANVVSALYEDAAGSLWIGTYGGGLARHYRGRFDAFSVGEGLTHDHVKALYQDREGSLWIGTLGGGLNRLRGSKFATLTTAEGLSHDVVLSVLEDHRGSLWIGTDGGGLNRIDGDRVRHFTTADGLSGDFIYALHEDRSGQIWAGVYAGGLCRLEGERFSCLTTAAGLSSNNVFSIFEDSRNSLWIGTDAGLNRYHEGRFTLLTTKDGLPNDLITGILEDATGSLWIGTYGGGLARLAGQHIRRYDTADGLSSGLILTLYEDSAGTLWVGTESGGLCHYRADRFACASSREGLFNDNVLQILEDDAGYLWLGSLKGISRISRRELLRPGSAAALDAPVFSEGDGLRSSETNGGTQPAAWRTRDGRLCFSTMKGLACIEAATLSSNPLPPPVLLEAVLLDGEPLDTTHFVELPPGSRKLTFRYTALSLAAPDAVRFMYKLEGYDAEWVDAGTAREVYFTSLPPGAYRFRVKACNNDGYWNETGTALAFYVKPFFYQTVWFYVLCGGGLLLAGASGYWLRARHLQVRAWELGRLVQEQTTALETLNKNLEAEVQRQLAVILTERERYERELIRAKEKAEESAQLKSLILTNMSHEIRTPITAILGYAQVLSEEVGREHQEFVDYIEVNGKRLLHTLNSILDFAKLERGELLLRPVSVDLSAAAREAVNLLAPMARRKGLTLLLRVPAETVTALADQAACDRILHNLIGNATKFTEHGQITVETGRWGTQVFVKVQDTGIGIGDAFLPHIFEEFKQESTGLTRSHEGSGLGLAITRRLVEAMGGKIAVESKKGAGSLFTVYFPSATGTQALDPTAWERYASN